MKSKSKPILLAIAAFAVTASGVQAFSNTQLLERAGLTEKQISAFEIAREKREAGDLRGARDVLVEAGVDEEVLQSVREVAHEEGVISGTRHHGLMRGHRFDELSNEQRDALEVARKANDKEAAKAILEEAGINFERHGHRF